MSNQPTYLAFDIGGTTTRWAVADDEANLIQRGSVPTADERGAFLKNLELVIEKVRPAAIGIGIAGTVSADHDDIIVCTNVPSLSHLELGSHLRDTYGIPVALDNDARCALIGEATKGAAQETSSAVMVTIGTGVGGAVMQRERILPHPEDITKEIGHIMADPTDLFPATAGAGTIEALLGGKNLEARFDVKLAKLAEDARKGKEDALEIWKIISYYFAESVRGIQATYSPKMMIIGGKGAKDLDLYMQDEMPFTIIPAALGEDAGLVGAAQIAIEALETAREQESKDWDEE